MKKFNKEVDMTKEIDRSKLDEEGKNCLEMLSFIWSKIENQNIDIQVFILSNITVNLLIKIINLCAINLISPKFIEKLLDEAFANSLLSDIHAEFLKENENKSSTIH